MDKNSKKDYIILSLVELCSKLYSDNYNYNQNDNFLWVYHNLMDKKT